MQIRHAVVQGIRTLIAATVLSLLACSSDPQGIERAGQGSSELSSDAVTIAVPANWVGSQLGIQSPTLTPIGKVSIVPPPVGWQADVITHVDDSKPASTAPSTLVSLTPDGTLSRLNLSADDINKIGSYMVQQGMNGSSSPGNSGNIKKGWPNGVDDRFRWSYYPGGDYPRDTIGVVYTQQGLSLNDCSATLFSNELILLAAHCLWPGNAFVWPNAFEPGQDGTTSVPYSSYGFTQAIYETGWANNNCSSTSYSTTCEMFDWSILRLSSSANVGYMGYHWSSSDSTVAGWYQYSAGYPNCTDGGAPSGCTFWTNWLADGCQIGSFFNYDRNCVLGGACANVNRNYKYGCSLSPGDSGGPLFSWSPGSNGPYIVGVAMAEDCVGSACMGNSTPSTALRIDQGLANSMGTLRSMYP